MINIALKFRNYIATAALALTAFVCASHAQAQSLNIKVNMPVAFEVGDNHFEAGQYTLRALTSHTLSVDGKQMLLSMANWSNNGVEATQNKVVLHKIGDRYYLSQVVLAGHREVFEPVKSRQQKDAEKAARNTQIASGPVADISVEAFN